MPMPNLLTRLWGVAPLFLILACLGWSGNPIAGIKLAGNTSPMLLTCIRWGLVVVVLGLVSGGAIGQAWGAVKHRQKWLWGMGGSIAMFNALFYLSANFTTAINIGIIQASIPVYILLLSFIFFAHKINKRQAAGVCLTIGGVLLVVSKGDIAILQTVGVNNWGDLIMVVACFFYAAYTIGLTKRPPINTFILLWFIAVAAFIATLPLALVEFLFGYSQVPTGDGWWAILYIVFIPSYLSQVFFIRGVDLIGANRAGIYANTVPIFTALLGIIILGESLQLYHVLSLLLVFGGIYGFERYKNKRGNTAG